MESVYAQSSYCDKRCAGYRMGDDLSHYRTSGLGRERPTALLPFLGYHIYE